MNFEHFVNEYLLSSTTMGFFVMVLIIMSLGIFIAKKWSSFWSFVELVYEKVYDFFEEIVWEKQDNWVKTYIVVLFFIILLSNLLGLILEIFAPIFWVDKHGEFHLEHYISIPSANINFNLTIATISLMIILVIQFRSLGLKHFVYDYFPIYWKGYIVIEEPKVKTLKYHITKVFVKIFDIIISLFLGLLEIIWLIAKIISLAFRLFGNMTSGAVLLAIAVVWIGGMTTDWLGFNFPVLLPVLIYLQELLVALIQALVFPLLVSIFIRLASSANE